MVTESKSDLVEEVPDEMQPPLQNIAKNERYEALAAPFAGLLATCFSNGLSEFQMSVEFSEM